LLGYKNNQGDTMRLILFSVVFVAALITMMLVPSYKTLADSNMLHSSVKITNLEETSGGSGVIVRTSATESQILTNAHVCRLFKNNGGLVHSLVGVAKVKEYKMDKNHDICLILVDQNFGSSAKLASKPPSFGDKVSVVGHPRLMPTIRTDGFLSERTIISVVVDVRRCTDNDDPLLCLLLGGIPMIEIYDTIVISALIQPGSSGSGVYNDDGEVIGLVFAGNGELSFGNIVPLENVKNFYDTAFLDKTGFIRPNYTQSAIMPKLTPDFVKNCSQNKDKICNIINNSFMWGFIAH
jgi:S1-C subfamily serine protease